MTDKEKVVRGLKRCIEKLDTVTNKAHGFNCTACPYFKKCDSSGYLVGLPLMRDALALLKAQEPVEPLHLHDQSKLPIKCGNCGAFIIIFNKPFGFGDYKAKYCCECGRAVKWE